jgi:hypothetical protein
MRVIRRLVLQRHAAGWRWPAPGWLLVSNHELKAAEFVQEGDDILANLCDRLLVGASALALDNPDQVVDLACAINGSPDDRSDSVQLDDVRPCGPDEKGLAIHVIGEHPRRTSDGHGFLLQTRQSVSGA